MSEQKHKFGLRTSSAFVIANMIGTGVFTSLGFQLMTTTNFISILLLWLFGGIIALCGALVYGELGAAMPRSGGEYHYLSQIYHPFVGFLSGWASLVVGFAAPVALACMALSSYVGQVWPAVDTTWLAIAILAVVTLVHSYDVKVGGNMQNVFTWFKVVVIVVFIVLGFILVPEYHGIKGAASSFSVSDVFSSGFAVALIWVYYAYSGWNASAYMANEIENPQKILPKSLLLSTLAVTVLYILLNAVFLLSTPAEDLTGKVEIGLICAQNIFGVKFGNVMGLLIAIMLISSISSMVFLGPRVSQVMGEDYKILSFLSKKTKRGTPAIAIWFQFAISFLLIITDSFSLVTKYTGITLSFFALMTVAGVYVHRHRFPSVNRPYKTWGYPVIPAIFCILIIWSIVYLVHDDYVKTFVTGEQKCMMMTIMSVATLAVGALIYWLNKFITKK